MTLVLRFTRQIILTLIGGGHETPYLIGQSCGNLSPVLFLGVPEVSLL